jgi:hypothetical protein
VREPLGVHPLLDAGDEEVPEPVTEFVPPFDEAPHDPSTAAPRVSATVISRGDTLADITERRPSEPTK